MSFSDTLAPSCFSPLPSDPKNLIILLHGYGSNGDNMLMLGDSWHHYLPHSIFYAPNAPTPHPDIYNGFQWCPLDRMDPQYLLTETLSAEPSVKQIIQQVQENFSIGWENTYLVGLSQGCFMALVTGLMSEKLCRGILGFSGGAYLQWENVKAQPQDLKVVLIHGVKDTIVPSQYSQDTAAKLQAKGFTCECFLEENVEHTISLQGLQKGLAFLQHLIMK